MILFSGKMCERELVLCLFDIGFFFLVREKYILLAYSLCTRIGVVWFFVSVLQAFHKKCQMF